MEYIQVRNYRARAQVVDLGYRRCRVLMSCTAEAEGAPDAEATARTRAFYEAMLGWIDDLLTQESTRPGRRLLAGREAPR